MYEKLERWLDHHPNAVSVIKIANKLLTGIGYFAYPVLLTLLAIWDRPKLIKCVIVPLLGFVCTSIFRYLYDAPRPSEVHNVTSPLKPNAKGKSFPSRHTLSMFLIAYAWLYTYPCIGLALFGCAVALAIIRVIGLAHFPRDVVCAFVIATVFSIIGYWIIP